MSGKVGTMKEVQGYSMWVRDRWNDEFEIGWMVIE